ncbi:MAG: FeoB-associated Cys-rich membrane protein [Sphaerochaetaceae bacterium]|jgi:hypothetical protein|nr:FeoB-associated Cys-rich membrane protein [Sphaerochaetaceae bacterium]
MVDYIIGIGAFALVFGVVIKAIIDKKNGKEPSGCSGNCSSCGGCNVHYSFEDKIK